VKHLFAAWIAFALLLLGVGQLTRLTTSTDAAGHGSRDARLAVHNSAR
jgi:hypothetical protein